MKFIIIPAALLLGAAFFIALLMVVKGGYFATKRKKTKLGLVKVAGSGLKFEDGEAPEGSEGQPASAEEGGPKIESAGVNTDSVVSTGAGVDDDAGGTDDDESVAADVPAADAVPDELDGYGEDAEYQETLAVPLESVNEENDADAEAPLPDEEPAKPVGPVRKIVELPVENPFINGKLADHNKKTTTHQRRRLPETVKMKDRRVILAEDVAINRDLIAMYFDGSGVKFEFAVNGREVCEKFERDPSSYSLILMDIQMPEMDGYEVSRKIRAMDVDWAKQIPIIAMTGNDQKEDIDRCFEAGMDDHIPKPIDMEVLQDKVFDILTLNAESY
jgi:CheY-like chemotaxis protein